MLYVRALSAPRYLGQREDQFVCPWKSLKTLFHHCEVTVPNEKNRPLEAGSFHGSRFCCIVKNF